MPYALYVAIAAAAVAMIACALSVFAWSRIFDQVSRLRSMTLLQGELLEIRDYVAKLDAWAKRINMREVMRERHDAGIYSGKRAPSSLPATSSKDELRRRVGLVAGHAAPHQE